MWGNADTSMGASGGFVAEENASFSGASGAKDGVKRSLNVVPLMIGHILNSKDKLEIFGIEIRIASIVGIVTEIEEQTTKITYKIQDDTGVITAFYWIQADKSVPPPSIQVNTYVRVRGIPRNDPDGQKHILILRIVALKSYNEFVCHMLEVIDTTLKARKLTEERDKAITSRQENKSMNEGNEFNREDAFDESHGLSKDQMSVFKLIQAENESESGIERSTLKNCVPKDVAPKVDAILAFLMSEGHIYTTCTDDHFKTT